MIDLAIAVAHCAQDHGADDPDTGVNEYEWSQRASRVLAELLASRPYGLDARLIDTGPIYSRSIESLRAQVATIKEWHERVGVRAAIAIHFDRVTYDRGGPTCGFWSTQPAGRRYAKAIRADLASLPGFNGAKRPIICYPDERYRRDEWCRGLAEECKSVVSILVEVAALPIDSAWLALETSPERAGVRIAQTLYRVLERETQA